MYNIIIEGLTEKSSKLLKEEIEKLFPLIDGRVKIYKEPEERPLNEIIEEYNNQFKKKRSD